VRCYLYSVGEALNPVPGGYRLLLIGLDQIHSLSMYVLNEATRNTVKIPNKRVVQCGQLWQSLAYTTPQQEPESHVQSPRLHQVSHERIVVG